MCSALLGVMVGATGLATAVAAAADFDPTIAEEMLIEAGFGRTADGILASQSPAVVATGEEVGAEGISNGLEGGTIELYDFGGVDLSERVFDTPNLDLIEDLDLGDPTWFAGQPGGQLVTFRTQRSPDLVDGRIGEVAIGYNLPGQEVLESSDFGPGDPLIGLGSNLSVAGIDGQIVVGHAIVTGGRFAQTSNPLPVWTWYTADGFGGATLLPATATDIQITISESADGTPASLVSAFGRPSVPNDVLVLDGAADAPVGELFVTRQEFEAILGLGDEATTEGTGEATTEATGEPTEDDTAATAEAGEFSGLIVNVTTLEYLHREEEQFGAVAATFGLDPSTGPFVAPIRVGTAMDDHRHLSDLSPDQASDFLAGYLERQLGSSLTLYADRISEAHLGRGGVQLPGGWIAPTFGAAFMNLTTDVSYIDDWCGFFVNVGDRRVIHDGDPLFDELLDQFGFDGPVERNDAMLSSMIDDVAVL